MFEWKVEDCKLMNDPGATVNDDGKKYFLLKQCCPEKKNMII